MNIDALHIVLNELKNDEINNAIKELELKKQKEKEIHSTKQTITHFIFDILMAHQEDRLEETILYPGNLVDIKGLQLDFDVVKKYIIHYLLERIKNVKEKYPTFFQNKLKKERIAYLHGLWKGMNIDSSLDSSLNSIFEFNMDELHFQDNDDCICEIKDYLEFHKNEMI